MSWRRYTTRPPVGVDTGGWNFIVPDALHAGSIVWMTPDYPVNP